MDLISANLAHIPSVWLLPILETLFKYSLIAPRACSPRSELPVEKGLNSEREDKNPHLLLKLYLQIQIIIVNLCGQ